MYVFKVETSTFVMYIMYFFKDTIKHSAHHAINVSVNFDVSQVLYSSICLHRNRTELAAGELFILTCSQFQIGFYLCAPLWVNTFHYIMSIPVPAGCFQKPVLKAISRFGNYQETSQLPASTRRKGKLQKIENPAGKTYDRDFDSAFDSRQLPVRQSERGGVECKRGCPLKRESF